MNFQHNFITEHPYTSFFIFWLFSNAVAALPAPDDKSPKWYTWLYSFGHSIAGSLPRLAATVLPNNIGKFSTQITLRVSRPSNA